MELVCVEPKANYVGVVASIMEGRMQECCMSYGTSYGGALFANHDNDNLISIPITSATIII